MALGIDPVHFGIIMVINLALGFVTPPFGVNLFAACTISRIPVDTVYRHVLPFVVVVLAALLLLTFVPEMSLFARDLVYR